MRRRREQPGQSGLNVLVVDDDPIFRSLVRAKLERLAHAVQEAEDGAVGWRLMVEQHFQLVLVDLEMPNFNGVELIRCVRAHPRTCRVPIVVVTSRNDSDAVRHSLAAGATSFVTKPLNWSMFSNHIEFLLRLHGAAERAHDLEMQISELLGQIDLEIGDRLGRITSAARNALDLRRSLGGEARMAAALEGVITEAHAALELLTELRQWDPKPRAAAPVRDAS